VVSNKVAPSLQQVEFASCKGVGIFKWGELVDLGVRRIRGEIGLLVFL